MRIFQYDFEFLSAEHIQDLLALEREKAIYADQWIDAIEDFRHVRIRFSQVEIEEYVRGLWAYELFIRAGSPARAADVPGIPDDIAQRADAYVMYGAGGRVQGPPYHCPAGFIGEELERLVCFTPESRREILEEQGKAQFISTVKRAADALTPAMRLFGNREKGLTPWPVQREDDVRDLLYAMLRASISDIKREEPVPSRALGSTVVDIFSATARLFIEVKWIGEKGRWKRVSDQIAADIQSYARHPQCETIVFVVVDAAKDIPDPACVQRELTGGQTIGGKYIDIFVFVREP
jgi:hypothetical protein